MNELFAKLKRLFAPRPGPPETVGEATADRPPPPAAAPLVAEPPAPAAPTRVAATLAVDDLAEIRAALEAVAEPRAPTPAPAPTAPVPTLPAPPADETAEVPAPEAGRVGDALVLTLGTTATTFTVAKTSATLGRGQENSIRLDDLSVSRRHARIAYRQGGYWLSDLGSMGGTWVNGTRLSAPRRIAAGEVIDIGLCRLTVSFAGGAAKSPTKKGASRSRIDRS